MNDIYKMEITDKNKLEKIWKIIGNYSDIKRKIIGNLLYNVTLYNNIYNLIE